MPKCPDESNARKEAFLLVSQFQVAVHHGSEFTVSGRSWRQLVTLDPYRKAELSILVPPDSPLVLLQCVCRSPSSQCTAIPKGMSWCRTRLLLALSHYHPFKLFLKAHLNSFVTPAHPLSTRDHICLRPRVSSSNQSRNTYPTRTRPGNYTKEHFKCQVPRPQHIMKNIHSIHSLLLYRNSNFIRSRLLLVLVPGLCILFRNSFLVLISSSPSPIFYHTQGVWSYAKVLNQSGIEFCAA